MYTDSPKTVNDAIKILAYNDYFWNNSTQNSINPHNKDLETVRSLAEAQYAWTEKQAKLAVVILKRYATKFQKYAMDITDLINDPKFDSEFRVISFEKSIEKITIDDEEKIIMRFPYNKKIITLIRQIKDSRGVPAGYSSYDGDSKKWTFKYSDVITYYLMLIAIRYDFKIMTPSLLDDLDTIRKEIKNYKKPSAMLQDKHVILQNVAESLQEYWDDNIKNTPLVQQLDTLKQFGIPTRSMKVQSWSEVGGRIASHDSTRLWIDKKEFSKDQVMLGFMELDCFPLILPITGDPNSYEDAEEWKHWLDVFKRHGIENKNLSFGFDVKAPEHHAPVMSNYRNDWEMETQELDSNRLSILHEISQLSKQFKYIDSSTKIIFVRNRIPKSLIKSKMKPKCVFVALGGGYYTGGTDNLKRYLDSLQKTVYYNDHQPSSFDWRDKVITKI